MEPSSWYAIYFFWCSFTWFHTGHQLKNAMLVVLWLVSNTFLWKSLWCVIIKTSKVITVVVLCFWVDGWLGQYIGLFPPIQNKKRPMYLVYWLITPRSIWFIGKVLWIIFTLNFNSYSYNIKYTCCKYESRWHAKAILITTVWPDLYKKSHR